MKSRALLGVFVLLGAMLLLVGCGGPSVPPAPPVLNSISLSPSNLTLASGATQQLTATGTFNNGSTQNLNGSASWISSNPAVATVSASGMVTATSDGTATITASSGTVNGSTTLSVKTLQSITVTPANPTITHSATQQFTATGHFSDGSTQALTSGVVWTSSATTVATINSSGRATSQGAGQTTITATSGGVSGTTTLTVNPPVLQSITVTPANPTITHSATKQFTATGHFSDGSTPDLTASVTWTSSATTVATINAAGLATSVGAGQSTITATSGSVSGSTTLTVNPPALQSITVTPANPIVTHSATQQFTATGSFSDGTTQDITATVTWTSSLTTVATINAAGLATTKGVGQTTIKATKGSVNGQTTLKVNAAALQSIAVTPANPTVTHSATQQFTATGSFSDGTTQNLTSSVTWSSSAGGVATISGAGLATTQGAGQTTITATSGSISGSTTLTVNPAVLQSITVTPANPTVTHSATQQFTATGHFSDGSSPNLTASVTWTSSATSVATINAAGLATSVGAGQSTITATLGSVSGSTVLKVNPPALQSITVTPANPIVTHSATQQFTATGSFSDGTTQDITATVTWTSSLTTVATINAAGLATTKGTGQTTIKAAQGSVNGSTLLKVNAAALQSITVTPANPTVTHSATQQFTATGTFSDGSTQNITSSATWSSSSTGVATINGSGLATTQGAGQTTITATSGSISGSTTLTVNPAVLQSITVTPANPTVTHSATQQFTATGHFSDGSSPNLTASVTWTSSATSVATINAAGLATSAGAGQTTITATLGSVSGSTVLTVNPPALQSITVTPANPTVTHSATQQFTATGSFSDGSTQNITATATWTSTSTAVATINSSGLATTKAAGTTTIRATSGSVIGSTTLTVNPPVLQSIAVTPANPTVIHSATQQFTATGTFSDGTTQNLTSSATWSSSASGVATINSAGLATTQGIGQTTITATSGSVSGSTTLTVNSPPVLQSITVTPANPTVTHSATQQFTATGHFSDGSTQNLTASATWSSSNGSAATINNAGLATTQGAGQTTITATSGSISGSTVLTVNTAALQSITVTPASPTVTHSATQQFTATGSFSDGSTQNITATVTWTSTNAAAATINSAGLATTQGAGQTTIRATSGSVNGSTVLTVNPPVLQSIAVTPAIPTITHIASQQFTATGTFSDGSTQNITSSVTWTSSSTGVATITAGGLASSVSAGQTTITAASGSVNGSTLLTVNPPALQSIAVTPANSAIVHDGSQQFTATGHYSDGTTQDLTFTVTWTSSDENVAVIDNFGSAFAVNPGQTTITGTLGSISGSTTLTVNPPPVLQSITVTPANPTIPHNGSQQFTATGNYSDGTHQDLTFSVTWSSSNAGVATVDDPFNPGLAAAVAQGQTTITATLGAINGSTTLTVSPPPTLQSIEVTPANPSIALGTNQQFAATGHFSDGSTQDLTASVTWGSSDTGVATINGSGLASSVAAGQTTITATQGAINGSTTLTVTSTNRNSLLNGAYVLQISEVGDPPYIIGRFVADGIGNISGVLDVNEGEFSGIVLQDVAFSGTYIIGNDGRGTLTLSGDPGTFGPPRTLKVALVDGNKGYLATWDATGDPEPGGDLGWFEKQSGTLSLSSGGYAFQFRGNSTMGAVGRVVLNSTGGVTGGAIDVDDLSNSGVILTNNAISGGSYSVGANGHGTLSITLAANPGAGQPSITMSFHIYLVSATKFVMVGQDTSLNLGGFPTDVSLGGVAEKQVGTLNNAAINGTFVYQMGSTDAFDGQIGRFSSGGTGGFTGGSRDRSVFGFWNADDPFTATFIDDQGNPAAVSSSGRGMASVNFTNFGFQENWVFYLISSSRAFVMQADSGTGVAGEWSKQTAPPLSFSGTFAFAIEGFDSGDSTRSGVSTPSGSNIAITQDASRGGVNTQGESVNTTFTLNGNTGKGSIADPATGSVSFYMIDANRMFMLQLDDFTVLFGEAKKQNLP